MHGQTNPSPVADPRCPGCGERLSPLPVQAVFCPACGRRLVVPLTPWRIAVAIVSRLVSGPGPEPTDKRGPRAAVIVGYSNALWRLGWRYEHGRGAIRNVPEAIRCYRKSADLGNAEAQSRLEVGRAEPVPVVSIGDVADDRRA